MNRLYYNFLFFLTCQAYKKGHFTLMRKKRSDFELSDYVCPMSPVLSTRTKIISMIQQRHGIGWGIFATTIAISGLVFFSMNCT